MSSFGFEKPKRKTHVLGLRLDDIHYAKLLNLFERFQVQPKKDTMTARITQLIDHISKFVVDYEQITEEKRSYASKIASVERDKRKLANEISTLVSKALKIEKLPRERPKPKDQPPKNESVQPIPRPVETPIIEPPQPLETPITPLANAVMQTSMSTGKAILEKHGLIETRTPVCAKGQKYLTVEQCDACSYHNYCDYSSANKHFISHNSI